MSDAPWNPRDAARRLGLGRVMFRLVYNPRNFFRRVNRVGWRQSLVSHRGELAMKRAAHSLAPISGGADTDPEIYFLTGARFWHQTLFCAWSLCRASDRTFRIVLYDDGSLSARHIAPFERIFPGRVRIVSRTEVERRLDLALPIDRYPTLRQRRLVYPNLRKVTDIHAAERGWKLVLDSDMLFFDRPVEMLQWLDAPGRILLMEDIQSSYGYPQESMERIAGVTIPPRLNVGVCGLSGDSLDFQTLESWQRQLIASHGTSYYEEQALIAMLASRDGYTMLPRTYICAPTREQAREGQGVLQHYVADSKSWYFEHAWRRLLERYP